MTLGIAFANLIFIQGITSIADNRGITESAPVNIKLHLMTAGFDLAFFFSFVVAIVILILALLVRQEVHPDYRSDNEEGAITGII